MAELQEYEPLWGNWFLEKEIGSGGFGTVYKARKEELGHIFYSAVKHIAIPKNDAEIEEYRNLLSARSDEDVEAFLKEKAQGVLDEFEIQKKFSGCKNIVEVQDLYSCPSRRITLGYDVFIRMELLKRIHTRIDIHQPDEHEVIRLGKDICRALMVLHKELYVHRDIRPQNILVSEDGTYKLSDFGTVRKMEHPRTRLDQIENRDYQAPEVIRGDDASVNSDLYSLGLVLYVLMNRYRMPDYNDRTVGNPFPAPEMASPEFTKVILKACEYDSKKRYQTADEMLWGLEKLADPTPTPTPTPEPPKCNGIKGSMQKFVG